MNGRKPCILVTGGATPLHRRIRLALRAEGYDVLKASSYSRAVAMTHGYRPDLVLLDMDLPGTMDGFDFCSMIRQSLQTPIIAISVQSNLQRTVRALDLGVDDYLAEPLSMDELLARLRACLRRATAQHVAPHNEMILYSYDRLLYMDVARQQVHVDSEPVYLTPKEFHLLYLLLLHAGKVLTHRFLLQQVWGEGYSEEKGYVRVCICQLRKKIPHDYILTQTTVGYLFRDKEEVAKQRITDPKRAIRRESELLYLPAIAYREAR
jgi:two-component system KDP operon response regulator KdpE